MIRNTFLILRTRSQRLFFAKDTMIFPRKFLTVMQRSYSLTVLKHKEMYGPRTDDDAALLATPTLIYPTGKPETRRRRRRQLGPKHGGDGGGEEDHVHPSEGTGAWRLLSACRFRSINLEL